MKSRGRPSLKPSFSTVMWVLVELMRDIQGNRPRLSARNAAKRLEKEFRISTTPDRRALPPGETIRRHYKKFTRVLAVDSELKAAAVLLLEIGRLRREILGWDASWWQLVIDPAILQSKGYKFSRDGRIATRDPQLINDPEF